MREIKFRGYSKTKGWVYGNLLENDRPQEGSIYQILNKTTESRFDVEEASIGQYTGFKDKNGVEIYEGDILTDNFGFRQVVEYGEEVGLWETYEINDKTDRYDLYKYYTMCEVIGNIYEEKLKESK